MPSNVPPASPKRRRQGQLAKLTPAHKAKRLATRKRKGTWAGRVWAKRHIKGDI